MLLISIHEQIAEVQRTTYRVKVYRSGIVSLIEDVAYVILKQARLPTIKKTTTTLTMAQR